MSEGGVRLSITISKENHEKLSEQLRILKSAMSAEFGDLNSVTELVERYIEQLCSSTYQIQEMQSKMDGIFQAFHEKGVNVKELLDSFTEKVFSKIEDDEEDLEEETFKTHAREKKS